MKVAVVGSGMGGASAAHFLKERLGAGVEIDVLERNGRIGGRAHYVEFDGTPVEAGGSMFIERGHEYTLSFAALLGLNRTEFAMHPMKRGHMAVFDLASRQIVFEQSEYAALNVAKTLWRYGPAVLHRSKREVLRQVERWEELHPLLDGGTSFDTVEGLLDAVGLYDLTQMPLSSFLDEMHGADWHSLAFVKELAAAVMHTNYNQRVADMNALAGAISLAPAVLDPDEIWAVEGGNFLIPQGLLEHAGANVHLHSEVQRVRVDEQGGVVVEFELDGTVHKQHYDAVVVAAPLERAKVELPSVCTAPPPRSYAAVYTNFVTGRLNHDYFGVQPGHMDLVQEVFTAQCDSCPWPLPFHSLGTYARGEDHVRSVKVFTRDAPLSAELLSDMFLDYTAFESFPHYAYPLFSPPEQFASFAPCGDLPVFYTSTMENAASCYEAMAVAGKNIANLLMRRLTPAHTPEGDLPSHVDGSEERVEL